MGIQVPGAGGGGGGGGAVTIADGADTAEGTTTDAAVSNPASAGTLIALSKGEFVLTGALTETAPATDTASSGLNGRLQRIAQRLTSLIALFPSSIGIKTSAGSLSVAPASDSTFVSVPGSSTTGTESNVAASATSVTLLAANVGRRGAYIYNDGTLGIYMKYGSTASVTSFTYLIPPQAGWQVDDTYSGIITGIWASATGNARVTEVTA